MNFISTAVNNVPTQDLLALRIRYAQSGTGILLLRAKSGEHLPEALQRSNKRVHANVERNKRRNCQERLIDLKIGDVGLTSWTYICR